ncbi:MAG: N-6 DNA methylase [Helicobacter sp.]|uniref:N-6 DNA methylase n=1 Tax=Helicobacter sp. TaxID=218 RepID=UPI002A91C068|nr:N-6 DNA methylase [Helicobacter sp.]MDY5616542.1 N-6 DNA methylase [Helicobacter sp.]
MLKELLQIFQYLQKFHKDNLEVLRIILEFLLISKDKKFLKGLIEGDKEQIDENLSENLRGYGLEAFSANPKINRKKILKVLLDYEITPKDLENFIQAIVMHKTILGLYEYATPIEVNLLVCKFLDIKSNESLYNPCCGLGSLLFGVSERNFDYYGEDIQPKILYLAKILSLFIGFKRSYLEVADIFKESAFGDLVANKAFCYFPLEMPLNLWSFKDDDLEPFIKSIPEIPFLAYTLRHFKQKGVFIVRSLLLYKAYGKRLRKFLREKRLLEGVVEFPKNIFPHQIEEFSLLILSKQENKKVFFVDAQKFYLKEGKYNRLTNIDRIYDKYLSKQDSDISRLVDYESLDDGNFKASYYTQKKDVCDSALLSEFLECIYRGQRVEAKKDGVLVDCYNAGIKDFEEYGFSERFLEFSPKSDQKRIEKLRIQAYDILLSIRGVSPKVAIIGERIGEKRILPNAGILVLRPKSREIAEALYVYFLSPKGFLALSEIYQKNQDRIGEEQIMNLLLPSGFLEYQKRFDLLLKEGEQIKEHQRAIKTLLDF